MGHCSWCGGAWGIAAEPGRALRGSAGQLGTPRAVGLCRDHQASARPPCRSPRLTLLSAAVGVSGMKTVSSEDNSKPQRAVSHGPNGAWGPPMLSGGQNKETRSDLSLNLNVPSAILAVINSDAGLSSSSC